MSHIPTHASYLADVARAAHQTGKDLTLEEVAAVIEAVNSLGAANDTLARTGNTARDQEMYAAGIEVGEENAKHNAAIRAGAGWLPIESAPKDGTPVDVWSPKYSGERHANMRRVELAPDNVFYEAVESGPSCLRGVTHWMPVPAAPGVSTVEDAPVAYLTLDEEGSPCMLFFDVAEARAFCEIGEEPAALYRRPAPAAGDALDLTLAQKYEDARILSNANAQDSARWRAYSAQFPEISAAFLAVHAEDGGDPLPTIKGASITGGYVVVTPAGWDNDKATRLRDAILRLFPVDPVHTPRPSDELAAQRKGDA